MSDQPQAKPRKRVTVLQIVAGLFVVGFVANLANLGEKREAALPPAATATMPAYCNDKGTERLLECGWTEAKQKQMDADEARKKAAQRYFAERLMRAADCNRPSGKMSPTDIEDCKNDPGGLPWYRR